MKLAFIKEFLSSLLLKYEDCVFDGLCSVYIEFSRFAKPWDCIDYSVKKLNPLSKKDKQKMNKR